MHFSRFGRPLTITLDVWTRKLIFTQGAQEVLKAVRIYCPEEEFQLLEEQIPHYYKQVQDETALSVGKNNLEAAERRRKVIRDRIVRLLQPKGIKANDELADFLTLDCGSFEHWISRRKLEEFGFKFSHETTFSRGNTAKPIILFLDNQGKHNKKLAPQYEKVASVLNSHILVINKNTPIDSKLLKECSDLLWLNRDFFGDKNLTVLLDSFGGANLMLLL